MRSWEYRVAMNAPSRAESRGGDSAQRPAARIRLTSERRDGPSTATQVQRNEPGRTKPVATCLRKLSAHAAGLHSRLGELCISVDLCAAQANEVWRPTPASLRGCVVPPGQMNISMRY